LEAFVKLGNGDLGSIDHRAFDFDKKSLRGNKRISYFRQPPLTRTNACCHFYWCGTPRAKHTNLKWPNWSISKRGFEAPLTTHQGVTTSVQTDYFHHVRREIAPLLPMHAKCIVDVGCGIGATSAWLKSRYPDARTIGLEGNAAIRGELATNVDELHIVDLNGPLPEVGHPDLILFLDVLEHLLAPDKVLAGLARRLAPGGTVIVSLPNVAHLSVSFPLFVRGRFDYADAGILDRTHLHFFVRASAIALLNNAGLRVEKGVKSGFQGPRTRLIDFVTFGLLHDHLAKQYIISGVKMTSIGQGEIEWYMN
jgi:SAM-dependent methyltransferase